MKPKNNPLLRPASLAAIALTLGTAGTLFLDSAQAANSTWQGTGTDLNTAGNWTAGVPNANGDIATWDATVPGDLTLTYGTPFGNATSGTSLNITGGHTGNLLIKSTVANNDAFSLGNITIAANAGAFTFGNGTGNDRLTFRGTNTLTNNSANTATFASDVVFFSGGGLSPRTLAFGGSGNWQVDAPLTIGSGGSGSFTVTKQGDGTLTLAATNGYTGTTTVNQGTLLATKAAALPGYNAASKVSVLSGATLAVRAGGAGEWTSAQIDSVLGATTAAFASGSKLGIDVTTGNSFSYANNIGATQTAKGLVKSGAGTLTLSNTSTYTGATTVSGGKLVINGNISTSSLTTVQNTGTLDGSGIAGAVTVQDGGRLAAGNGIGSLTAQGNVSLLANSTFEVEINTAASYDMLAISSGSLNITSGAKLDLINFGSANLITLNSRLQLINYTGGTWNGGLLTLGSEELADSETFAWQENTWRINYNDTLGEGDTSLSTGGSYVTLTAIPEPGAALLGSLGMLALLRRRKNG